MSYQTPSQISAVIVADLGGGQSRTEYQGLEMTPQTGLQALMELLASAFDDLIIVAADPLNYLAYDGLIVRPHRGRRGILGAVQAGLFAARHPQALVTHGRLRSLKPGVMALLTAAAEPRWDVVAVCGAAGLMPYTAVYHKRCLKMMAHPWSAEPGAWTRFLKLVRVREIDEATVRLHDPDLQSFLGNDQADPSGTMPPGEKENPI